MPNRLLQRYLDGAHREVWHDLVSLGAAVRGDLHCSDAAAVAAETMHRARHNVESIVSKLEKLGYQFTTAEFARKMHLMMGGPLPAGPLDAFKPPDGNTVARLDRFETDIGGPLPISLRHWFQHVGRVDMMGFHEALNPADGQHYPDPLVIYSLPQAVEAGCGEDLSGEDAATIELTLAPDAFNKAHTSGGAPYAMMVPDLRADAPFRWERPNTTFVEYLRLVFAWGGFPGWEGNDGRPRKELDFLREDLLAL